MPDVDFPEYAVKLTKEVRAAIVELSPELRSVWDSIELGLAEDPFAWEERLTRIGPKRDICIYKYPSPRVEVTFDVDEATKTVRVWNVATPVLEVQKLVFISYSHEDENWLVKMRKFIGDLEEQDLVEFWDDRDILAGEKWKDKIEHSLDSAKAALLLVSQNFLASQFIKTEELPKLLEAAEDRGLKIFWIPLSASRVDKTKIVEFQALHDPRNPLDLLDDAHQNRALVEICRKLEDAVTSH